MRCASPQCVRSSRVATGWCPANATTVAPLMLLVRLGRHKMGAARSHFHFDCLRARATGAVTLQGIGGLNVVWGASSAQDLNLVWGERSLGATSMRRKVPA